MPPWSDGGGSWDDARCDSQAQVDDAYPVSHRSLGLGAAVAVRRLWRGVDGGGVDGAAIGCSLRGRACRRDVAVPGSYGRVARCLARAVVVRGGAPLRGMGAVPGPLNVARPVIDPRLLSRPARVGCICVRVDVHALCEYGEARAGRLAGLRGFGSVRRRVDGVECALPLAPLPIARLRGGGVGAWHARGACCV